MNHVTTFHPFPCPAPLDRLMPRERPFERRLDLVRDLVVKGCVRRAHDELRAAVPEISVLPPTRGAHELCARAKLETARLGWYATGVGAITRLPRALALALEAHRELGAIPPAALRGDASTLVAGIACDLGDSSALEGAQAILTEVVTPLLREGATDVAATVLLAQAGLDLRLGHAAAVTDRVERSIELLGERRDASADAFAALHIAGVRHLLGRLPLHGAMTDSRDDAVIGALRSCRLAEGTFAEHGHRRALARVLETTARLEALRGRAREAHYLFERALAIADDIADMVGLARISAGIAALLRAGETTDEALAMLATSIALNLAKGSRTGLACDEAILVKIAESVAQRRAPHPTLDLRLVFARSQLSAAIASMES